MLCHGQFWLMAFTACIKDVLPVCIIVSEHSWSCSAIDCNVVTSCACRCAASVSCACSIKCVQLCRVQCAASWWEILFCMRRVSFQHTSMAGLRNVIGVQDHLNGDVWLLRLPVDGRHAAGQCVACFALSRSICCIWLWFVVWVTAPTYHQHPPTMHSITIFPVLWWLRKAG